jgi:hypothetical protein
MSKRAADRELTSENFEDDEDDGSDAVTAASGSWKASEEKLKRRVIVKAKRSLTGSAPPSATATVSTAQRDLRHRATLAVRPLRRSLMSCMTSHRCLVLRLACQPSTSVSHLLLLPPLSRPRQQHPRLLPPPLQRMHRFLRLPRPPQRPHPRRLLPIPQPLLWPPLPLPRRPKPPPQSLPARRVGRWLSWLRA